MRFVELVLLRIWKKRRSTARNHNLNQTYTKIVKHVLRTYNINPVGVVKPRENV
jgi:hypothetical protein